MYPVYFIQPTVVSQASWRFDAISALIGAALAFLLAGLAYAFREKLGQAWQAIAVELGRFVDYMRASTEESYRQLVASKARSFMFPAHVTTLDQVFVEPQFLVPPLPAQSISEVEATVSSRRVLPLHRVLGGHPRLLIQGGAGAGKTTTLAYLALVCATAFDKADKRVDAQAIPASIRERLPLYISLSAINWGDSQEAESQQLDGDTGEQTLDGQETAEGEEVDELSGLDDLLIAAVTAVGGGKALVKPLREYLEAGRGIVLVDGWDELAPQRRELAATWLAELADSYEGNVWLIGTGMRNYALLTEADFIPLVMTQWDAGQVADFAAGWVSAFEGDGDRPFPIALDDLVAELQRASRGRAAVLELALRTYAALSGTDVPLKRAALFGAVMDVLLQEQAHEEEPWWLATCRAALGQVALDLHQAERATASREEIEEAIEVALPPADERPARAAARVFRALTGDQGLLREVGSSRYAFVHQLWQAYLVARQLVAVDPTSLVEHLEDANWSEVFRFYAELGDMRPLVSAWLRTPDDVFYTRLRTLASWIAAAPAEADWREGTMAVLARAFLKPGALAPARKVLAEALATTGMSGITYFLKQALQHANPDVRIAAIHGLSGVAEDAAIAALDQVLLDNDDAVCEAAVQALASIGSEEARRRLELILLEGDDALRPAAAAALVEYGDQGAELLRELVNSEDMMTRRAVIFGLARINERDLLDKLAREDGQWIVRSAASAALEELERQEQAQGVEHYPKIDQLPWLISWAATQGEGVGTGEAARDVLRLALSAEQAEIRLAAAWVVTQVGRPADVELLKTLAFGDPDPMVANAALEALDEISRRYDLQIKPS